MRWKGLKSLASVQMAMCPTNSAPLLTPVWAWHDGIVMDYSALNCSPEEDKTILFSDLQVSAHLCSLTSSGPLYRAILDIWYELSLDQIEGEPCNCSLDLFKS